MDLMTLVIGVAVILLILKFLKASLKFMLVVSAIAVIIYLVLPYV